MNDMVGCMELPYISGLFDGEGSVTITKPTPSEPRRHRLIVQIAMTHRPTINAIRDSFGGRVQIIQQAKYNEHARDRYDWRLAGPAAASFLRSIRPWSITKAAAIDLALQFPFGTKGRNPGSAIEERELLRLALRQENLRGR